jgi:Tfp pilus assembly protein PilV
MSRNESRERGSSLVEVIVAVGLFAIALLGINGLLVSSMRASEQARDLATARFLAESRLDQIKRARYQDGDRDAYLDTSDPCTDIDEIIAANWPDENYGAVDLLNGTRWNFRSCSAVTNIKQSAVTVTAASYPGTAQGRADFQTNHDQYRKFRREVYIYDTSAATTATVMNVTLDGPRAATRDNIVVSSVTPTADNPRTNFIKYVLVRVKWRDNHGQIHHVTLSTEKAFVVPAS